jgi:DNA adenine methylase
VAVAAPKPFLRWVGGKRRVVTRLLDFLPPDWQRLRYLEPFLGAGSLFFTLRPARAVLADSNDHLISCYEHVRDAPRLVGAYLREHVKRDSRRHYCDTRDLYNRSGPSAAQAARFIYLNATCFNGIFRVNRKGEFNVPYGDKDNPIMPSPEGLANVSVLLKKASLKRAGYGDILAAARDSDLVYLDPPYPPLNGTSYFTHYTADRFSHADQVSLAKVVRAIDGRGVLVMMTNAATREIRDLYKRFYQYPLSVTRWVSCKAKPYKVRELVITNYRVNL